MLKSLFGFFISLYCNTLALSLICYSGPALLSFWSPGHYLFGNIKNYTAFFSSSRRQFVNNIRNGTSFFSPSGLITAAFEYLEYPWSTIIFLLLGLHNVFLFLPKVKQFIKNTIQEPALRQSSCGWQGVWEDMGRYLSRLSPPRVFHFTPEQVQNPKTLVECLKDICPDPGNTRELQLAAFCWGLASAYQTVINTAHHPQGDGEVFEFDDQITHTATIPEDQPSMVSVAPIIKTKQ